MTVAFPITRDDAIHIITDIQFYSENYSENEKIDKLIEYLKEKKQKTGTAGEVEQIKDQQILICGEEVEVKINKKTKPEFDIEDRGFRARAWYIKDGKGDALIEIKKGNKIHKEFKYPSYKIWNIVAHFSDIVDGELKDSDSGYRVAGSTGFGGYVMPRELKNNNI